MEKLKELLEKLGWKVEETTFTGGEKGWEIQRYSPAGEDLSFIVCHNDNVKAAIKEIEDYVEHFDEDEHIEMWVQARNSGVHGVPSIKELVKDAEEIHRMLDEMSEYISNHIRICSECGKVMVEGYLVNSGDEYYCNDECLHKHYTEEEWNNMYSDDSDENYWTSWEE